MLWRFKSHVVKITILQLFNFGYCFVFAAVVLFWQLSRVIACFLLLFCFVMAAVKSYSMFSVIALFCLGSC